MGGNYMFIIPQANVYRQMQCQFQTYRHPWVKKRCKKCFSAQLAKFKTANQ